MTNNHGGSRPGSGRPRLLDEPMESHSTTMPASYWRVVYKLGNGNYSEGLRGLVKQRRKMITVTIIEDEASSYDFLADPDTHKASEEDIAAYRQTLTSRMLEALRAYGVERVEIDQALVGSTEFEIDGLEPTTDEYYRLQTDILPEVYQDVASGMGQDWSWLPSYAQATIRPHPGQKGKTMNRYQIHRNGDFYAILDTTVWDERVGDHKLVINGNLWDGAYVAIEEEGITEEQWILRHQADELHRYERTGLTVWDRYNAVR